MWRGHASRRSAKTAVYKRREEKGRKEGRKWSEEVEEKEGAGKRRLLESLMLLDHVFLAFVSFLWMDGFSLHLHSPCIFQDESLGNAAGTVASYNRLTL